MIGAVFAMISALFVVMVVLVGAAVGREVALSSRPLEQVDEQARAEYRASGTRSPPTPKSRWRTIPREAARGTLQMTRVPWPGLETDHEFAANGGEQHVLACS